MEITNEIKTIISEWCKETGNKVTYTDNGIRIIPILERKGAYLKENNPLDNDLPILNKALVEYMYNKTPVEDTINNCNDMIMFQSIYRLSGKYKFAWHNGEYLTDKTYRVFASKDKNDTTLTKCTEKTSENVTYHSDGYNLYIDNYKGDKFQDCPEHCFIYNQSVKDIPMSIKLDKRWYIEMAKERLAMFGYKVQFKNELF